MNNLKLIYFLAGVGTVSIIVFGYKKFIAKPKVNTSDKLPSIVK